MTISTQSSPTPAKGALQYICISLYGQYYISVYVSFNSHIISFSSTSAFILIQLLNMYTLIAYFLLFYLLIFLLKVFLILRIVDLRS